MCNHKRVNKKSMMSQTLTTIKFIAQVSAVVVAVTHQGERQAAASVTTKLSLWTNCGETQRFNKMFL